MLGRQPPLAVFGKVLTFLVGPHPLQQQFLGMESYRASLTLSSSHALGPPGA